MHKWLPTLSLTLGALASLATPAGATPIPFAPKLTLDSNADGVMGVDSADLDGDGDLDVVAAAHFDDEVLWYENVSGVFTEHVLGAGDGAISVRVGDIDGDGDLDVAAALGGASDIVWYENAAGDASTWTRHDIDTSFGGAVDVDLADIDGDGDLDVLAVGYLNDDVTFFENTVSDGTAWTEHTLASAFDGAWGVSTADMDLDGDIDVLAAAYTEDEVAWWENTAGDGSAWTKHVVGTPNGARDVAAADMDGDGDPDVVSVAGSGGGVAWWENTAGTALSWTQRTIWTVNTHSVAVGDFDLDGDIDVAAAALLANDVMWFENTDGVGGSWTRTNLATSFSGTHGVASADVDGDGRPDILATARFADEVALWTSDLATPGVTTGVELPIETGIAGLRSVSAGDLDGDGDPDAVSTGGLSDQLSWHENDGGVWTTHVVDAALDDARSARPADIDGDGDLDLIATSDNAHDVVWYENTTGAATTWTKTVVNGSFVGAVAVRAADIDGDGDLDLLGAANTADDVAWFENATGDGSAWVRRTIDPSHDGARDVVAGDIDGDGDLDVVAPAYHADLLHWWENDGDGLTWTEHVVSAAYDGCQYVELVDVDRDGDLDIASTTTDADTVDWWENVGGAGAAWTRHPVATSFGSARQVTAVDLDQDGDIDFAAAAYAGDQVAWFENTDGVGGAFTQHLVDSGVNGALVVAHADFDADGDLDLLAGAYLAATISSYELDRLPIVDPGGPYAGLEGGSVTVDASASFDLDGPVALYEWDCDGDGSYESALATPTAACTYADDGVVAVGLRIDGETATTTVTIANVAPSIAGSPSPSATEASTWSYVATATDPGADTLTWSLLVGPGGMSVSAGGVFSWTPAYADVGSHPVSVEVADGDGGTDTQSFTIAVAFLDADTDGLPDTWELSVGMDPTNPSDAQADPDADGLDNAAEYAGGTDPNVFDGPDVPAPTSPIAGAEVDTSTPELAWSNASDPQADPLTYDVEVFVGLVLTGSPIASVAGLPEAAGSTTWTVDAVLPENADCAWRVRAADPFTPGTWSDLEPLFVNVVQEEPGSPALAAPIDGQAVGEARPELSWAEAVDVDRDALTYDVRILDPSGALVEATTGVATLGWAPTGDLVEDAEYDWQARAVDEHGLSGLWSAPATFVVNTVNGVPSAVELTAPEDGAELDELTAVLRATASADPEGEALTYVFEVDAVGSFDSEELASLSVAGDAGSPASVDLEAEGVELVEHRAAHFRVRVEDEQGAATDWDAISVFVRGPNDAPPAPVLLEPTVEETEDPRPVFVFAHAADPEGDAVGYELVLAEDAELSRVLEVFPLDEGAGPAGTADQASLQPPLPLEGTVFWAARAIDALNAASPWSAPRSVTIVVPVVGDDDAPDTACSQSGTQGASPALLLLVGTGLIRRRRCAPSPWSHA